MTYDWESDYAVRGKLSAGKQASQAGDAVLLGVNGKIPDSFISGSDYKYSLTFDPTTFITDPTGCLTYADDAVGFTRVDNSASTSLQAASPGSWGNDNPMINSMFYATFDADGNVHHILDPSNLTKDINGEDRSTEITQENVMLVIPTIYTKRNANGISISSKRSEGTAYAHTYDGHTYKYLAIGVYEGTIVDSKLMSVSGSAEPAYNVTRAACRTAVWKNSSSSPSTGATANGQWMLTNWHVRQLIRDITIMTLKSFDSQRQLGQGFSLGGSNAEGNRALAPGLANTLGRFAGNAAGTSNVVKCLIENPWASKWEFIDDIMTGYNDVDQAYADIYVGQQKQVQDDLTKMTLLDEIETTNMHASTNAFCTSIHTGDVDWGLWNNHDGSDATGLCDKHWSNPDAQRLAVCGGYSADGSADGVSALYLGNALSHSYWNVGARPVFVFD